jgi:succinoglycan biosynthesis protein ExoA
MSPHRILHLRASNFVGGPEHQLLRYAESECHDAWSIVLGTFRGPEEGSDFLRAIEARGLDSVSLPASSWGSALRALIQVIRRERIELLCTHGYRSDVLGLLAGRHLDIPVACFLRGWTRENYKVRLHEAIDRFAVHFADRVVCLSATQARKLSRPSKPTDKIRIVCNAIDAPRIDQSLRIRSRCELRRRFNLSQEAVVVATAGRLSPEKGASDFLEAIAHVKKHFPLVRFLIFGDGVLRQSLENRARLLNLADRVVFAGFHADLRGMVPGFDLLVNPSHSEEMPNIVLESLAAGIPVVATAVGGVPDIAGPEGALHLVPPRNPQILGNAIRELLGNQVLREKLAQAGPERVRQAFSVTAQQSQLHDLYAELLPPPEAHRGRVQNRIAEEPATRECQPAADGQEADFLSVVVPVRNEEAHIGTVLADLEAQDYPHKRFEVLVVDGNSTDRTAKIVGEIAKHAAMPVRLLANPSELSSAGRNIGARNARGKFVIYIDGHCKIPSRTLLGDAARLFERTGADCLCRPQPLTTPDNSAFQNVVAHARATPLGHARDSTIYSSDLEGPVNPSSSGALYRREVFDAVGFFDERFDACEDVEFNYRVFQAGLRSFYSPKLTVVYQPRRNFRSLWKQMARYGQGRCRLIGKHPEAFSFSQMIPASLLVWLGIGGISSFYSWRIAEFFLATLAVYFGVVVLFSLGLAVRHGWRHFLWAPFIYPCIHLGLGAGFLKEFLWATRSRAPVSRNATSSVGLAPSAVSVGVSSGDPSGSPSPARRVAGAAARAVEQLRSLANSSDSQGKGSLRVPEHHANSAIDFPGGEE